MHSGAPSSSAPSALIIALCLRIPRRNFATTTSSDDIGVPLRHGCVCYSAELPPSRWKGFLGMHIAPNGKEAHFYEAAVGEVASHVRRRGRCFREGSAPCVETQARCHGQNMGRREEPDSSIQWKGLGLNIRCVAPPENTPALDRLCLECKLL